MTTVAELAATGRGRIAYALEVPGLGVFTTVKGWTPYTSDYGDRHYPWLVYESLPTLREQSDPLEGSIEVDDLTVEIADVGGAMSALVRDWRASGYAYLNTTLTAAAAVASLDDVSWASYTGGTVWCEREALTYTGKSTGTLTGLSHGALQTSAADHIVDWDADPPRRPLVTDAPHVLIGRRCLLRQAVLGEDGTYGTPDIVYRGRIVSYRTGHGLWRLEIEHISAVLLEETCHGMPSLELQQGYYYAGTALRSVPAVKVILSGDVHEVVSTAILAGYYQGPADLATAWGDAVRTDGPSLEPQLHLVDDRWTLTCDAHGASRRLQISVYHGDPLWALGFDPGDYIGVDDTAYEAKAQNEPRACVVDFDPAGTLMPEVRTLGLDVLTHGCYVLAPGQPYAMVLSTAERVRGPGVPFTGTQIYLGGLDSALDLRHYLWAVEDEDDLVLQHAVVLGTETEPADLSDGLKTLLGLGSGDEPSEWFPTGIVSADIDTAELDLAILPVPPALKQLRRFVVKESEKLWDLLGPHFGLLGIFPRLTSTGKIGFGRLKTPTPFEANDVPIDAEVWALHGAREIESRVDHAGLINEVIARHSWDYREEEFSPAEIRITWDDGVNSLGATRAVDYPLRGLTLTAVGLPLGEREAAEAIRSQVTSTHFGSYGRAAAILEIPCTWTSRQILVGDYVRVTHDLAPDVVRGTVGVADQYGLVVGRSSALTGRDYDSLLVQLYPGAVGAGIAPCVRCAVYHPTTAQLVASSLSAYAQAGSTDVDWLSAGTLPCSAVATSRWVFTATSWSVYVTAASGSYIWLQSDAFSTAFPALGVYLTLPTWDTAVGWMREYSYQASDATPPVLGTSAVAAQEWTI